MLMKKILKYTVPSLVLFGTLAVGIIAVQAYGFGKGEGNPDHAPFFESLTQEQKDDLEEKKKEMWNLKEELRDLEPEERCERMQELKGEMEEWAEENGINFGFMRGHGRGHEKGFRGNYPVEE